jgi:hypothetical protein
MHVFKQSICRCALTNGLKRTINLGISPHKSAIIKNKIQWRLKLITFIHLIKKEI